MSVGVARPNLSELMFLLYSRTLHPELFEVRRELEVCRDEYQAIAQITNGCHSVCWEHQGIRLTEVIAPGASPLPKHRRLLSCKLTRERNEVVQCAVGVTYHTSFAVERLEPNVFARTQDELELDARKRGVMFAHAAGHRMMPAPLSHMQFEARARSLLVIAFHTFPDDCAIVKSQSLFEF